MCNVVYPESQTLLKGNVVGGWRAGSGRMGKCVGSCCQILKPAGLGINRRSGPEVVDEWSKWPKCWGG